VTVDGILQLILIGWIGLVMLARDWRFTLAGLGGLALCAGGLLWVEIFVVGNQATGRYSLIVLTIEVTTAVCTTALLGLAGVVLPRVTPMQMPEGMLDVTSTVRLAAKALPEPRWLVGPRPLLAFLGTLALWLGIARLLSTTMPSIASAAILLLCSGTVLVLMAETLFNVGVGLLVALYGIRLFYVGIAAQTVLVNLVLLSIVMILVALAAGYLAELHAPAGSHHPPRGAEPEMAQEDAGGVAYDI
jgi:hypothetical protein